MRAQEFGARVEDGEFVWDAPQALQDALGRLQGKRVRVRVAQERQRRSLPQNAHLWAGVYDEIVAQLFHDRVDITSDDVHEYAKAKFCPIEVIEMPGGETYVKRSTRNLSVEQMSVFTEKVMAHFANLGVEFD